MTNIGWVGCGKLGLPCALTLARAGHHVSAYDVSSRYVDILAGRADPPQEAGLRELIDEISGTENFWPVPDIDAVVRKSDIIFVAVQTPHSPAYGGQTEMPTERRDFDYSALTQAVRSVCQAAQQQEKHVTVVVVSTALPGTFNRHLRHLKNAFTTLVYNPFFIAMGTTIADFSSPEFVLVGADSVDQWDVEDKLYKIYRAVHKAPFKVMSIESAELTKVAYNTFISQKIVFANTIMEICHKSGADCDEVIDGLTLATQRVASAAYLRGGMGDGGACHPRDLIAMSWLAERLDLSTDLMGYLVEAREDQSRWLRNLAWHYSQLHDLPIVLLGAAYKPESDLVAGSPALLLQEQLDIPSEPVEIYDPHVEEYSKLPEQASERSIFIVTTKHEVWREWEYPVGSVVLDPFGYVADRTGVTVIRLGRKS